VTDRKSSSEQIIVVLTMIGSIAGVVSSIAGVVSLVAQLAQL
jgi:hypothetical protein